MAILQKSPNQVMVPIQERNFLFHVDLDCFFAAVEVREQPSLKGLPVIVGGDKESKRGVVTTCTYEARKFGVHSGMSILEALNLCPESICIRRGNYSLYREVSDSVMAILSSYTEEFRCASIDEAYLNLTKIINEEFNGNPLPLAEEIKKEIFETEGITCSIGIGSNTTIAKMATSQNKPNGITFIPKEKIKGFLKPLPVRRISGIGPKSAEHLKQKHGVETIGQIMKLETEYEMIRKYGSLGKFFFRVISGEGRTTLKPNDYYGAKSISKGRTFYGYLEDGEPITAEKLLPKLIDQVHERLIKRFFRFKTVTLEIKLQNSFKNLNKSRSFLAANDDKERITSTVFELLEDFRNTHKDEPIRKVAVRVSNFEKRDSKQKSITDFFGEK
ncbi:MAG: DNA polymerase IV [Candidatus Heimdallarchaeota archaeon]